MATVAGTINDLSNGVFHAKDENGNIRVLKVGDTIYENDTIYGDDTNSSSSKVEILLSGNDVIVLSEGEKQLIDSSLIETAFGTEELFFTRESLNLKADEYNSNADVVSDLRDAEFTAQKQESQNDGSFADANNSDVTEEETAEGEEEVEDETTGTGEFQARDGNATDIESDLRNAQFKARTQVFQDKSFFENESKDRLTSLTNTDRPTYTNPPTISTTPSTPTPPPPPKPVTPPPSIIIGNLSVDDVTSYESDGFLIFTVSLDRSVASPVTFTYSTSPLTATSNGVDYNDVTGRVTIPAGSTSITIKVPITDDYLSDNGETMKITISNVVGNVNISKPEGIGTILDNPVNNPGNGTPNTPKEPGGYGQEDTVYAIIVGPVSVKEGDTTTEYTVRLVDKDGNAVVVTKATEVTVRYTNDTTQNGDTQFNNNDTIKVTIPANGSSNTFTVVSLDDYLADNGEKYNLAITKVNTNEFENVVIGDKTGNFKDVTTTILDDTGTPNIPTDGVESNHEVVIIKLVALNTDGTPVLNSSGHYTFANEVNEGSDAKYMALAFASTESIFSPSTKLADQVGTVDVTFANGSANGVNTQTATDGSQDFNNTAQATVELGKPITTATFDDWKADNGETFTISITDNTYASNASGSYENVTINTAPVTTTILDDSQGTPAIPGTPGTPSVPHDPNTPPAGENTPPTTEHPETNHEIVQIKLVACDENGDPMLVDDGNGNITKYVFANEVPENDAAYYMAIAFAPDATVYTTATKLADADQLGSVTVSTKNLDTPEAIGISGTQTTDNGSEDYASISTQKVDLNTAFSVDTLDDYISDNGEKYEVVIDASSYSSTNVAGTNQVGYENVKIDTNPVTTTILDDADTTPNNKFDDPEKPNEGSTTEPKDPTDTPREATQEQVILKIVACDVNGDPIMSGDSYTFVNEVAEGSDAKYMVLAFKPGTTDFTTANQVAVQGGTVTIKTADGTAIGVMDQTKNDGTQDYVLETTKEVTLGQSFTVTTLDDLIRDNGETYNVSINDGTYTHPSTPLYENVKTNTAAVITTITDNTTAQNIETGTDPVKIVLVAVVSSTITIADITDTDGKLIIDSTNITSEGGTLYYIPVAVDADGKPLTIQDGSVTVAYGTTAATDDSDATATTDYVSTKTSANIGEVFSVKTITDSIGEVEENYEVTISSPTGTSYETPVVDDSHKTVISTIEDSVYVKIITNGSVVEGNDLTHTLQLVDKNGNPIDIDIPTTGTGKLIATLVYSSDETVAGDYSTAHTQNGTITVEFSGTTNSVTITNKTLDDFISDNNENYTLTITDFTQDESNPYKVIGIDTQKVVTGEILDGVILGDPVDATVYEDGLNTSSTSENSLINSLGIANPNSDTYTVSFDKMITTTDKTSNGQVITYSYNTDGTILTATRADNEVVFTVELKKDGSGNDVYDFKLKTVMDHDAPPVGTPWDKNEFDMPFQFNVTSNGTTSSNKTFNVTVVDSVPSADPIIANTKEDTAVIVRLADDDFKTGEQVTINGVAHNIGATGIAIYEKGDITKQIGSLTINSNGTVTFTPIEDYSNHDTTKSPEFTYTVKDFDGDEASSTVTINVKPVADTITITPSTPTMTEDDGNTKEGTHQIALELTKPSLSKDQIDKNSAAGDKPEKNGEITLIFTNGDKVTGAKIFKADGTTQVGTDITTANQTLKVVIVNGSGDVDYTYHHANITTGQADTLYLTQTEYGSLIIRHAEDNDTDIKIDISVTSYELDDDNKPLSTTDADLYETATANMTVKINPATDDISLNWNEANGKGTFDAGTKTFTFTTEAEGEYFNNPIDLKAILTKTSGTETDSTPLLGDLDGSEKRTYTVEGIPEGTVITLGGQTATAGSDGIATINFNNTNNKLADPEFSMKLPEHYSGSISNAKITLSVQDKGVDSGDIAGETKTAEVYFNVEVTPIADIATIQVKQSVGFEDAGRDGGNTIGKSDVINANGTGGIPLNIKVSSDDKDGSETFNIKIADIPNGSKIYYDGNEQTINSGVIEILNFDNAKSLIFIPPHNDDTDYTLKVSSQTVDNNGLTIDTSAWSSPKDIEVIVKNVADAPVGTDLNANINVNEDNKLNLQDIYTTPANLASYDASEELTVKINLPTGFTVDSGSPYYIENGMYVVKASDIKAGHILINVPENFSGIASFDLTYVTTEKAGENDSKTWDPQTVNIFVNPIADDVNVATSSTIYEDADGSANKINIAPSLTDTDGSETITMVKILASDVPAGYELYLDSAMTQSITSTLNGLYYELTPAQADSIYAKNTTLNSADKSDNFDLTVVYSVKDEISGEIDTADFTHTHTVNVQAVTDAPSLSVGTITQTAGNVVITGTTVTVNQEDSQFKVPVTTTSFDTDGSETVQKIVISGVPMGVEVVGATYYGYSGSIHNGIWVITAPSDSALDVNGALQDITFKVNQGANFDNRDITITTYTKDIDAEVKSASQTIRIEKTYTAGTEPGNPAVLELAVKEADIQEDTEFTLADVLVVNEITSGDVNGKTIITFTNIAEGTTVSGHDYEYVENGKTVYVVIGNGNAADMNTELSNVKITTPKDVNSQQDGALKGDFTLTADIVTYHNGGFNEGDTVTLTPEETISPLTDEMIISVTADNINEDGTSDLSITLSNPSDGTKTELIGNSITIKVTENWLDSNANGEGTKGTLTQTGADYIINDNNDGTYTITKTDGTPFTVDTPITGLQYTPATNRDGNVTFEVSVQNKETGSNLISDSKGSTNISVTPVIDVELNASVVTATGIEDVVRETLANPVKLEITAGTFTDGSEKIGNIILDEVPNGFTVWYKVGSDLVMATNIGKSGTGTFDLTPNISGDADVHRNKWLIPASADGSMPEVYINAPENWSGDFDFKAKFTVSEQNLSTATPIEVGVTGHINAVADGVTIDPTLTFGDAFSWVSLNLNANMKDVDGSETMSLEITGLNESAQFQLANGAAVNATLDGTIWKLEGITYDQINNIQFAHDKSVASVGVIANTVEIGNAVEGTSTDEKGFELKLSDVSGSFKLDEGLSLDFDKIASLSSSNTLKNVSTIDLTQAGENKLENITLQDVLDMTDSNNTLKITGDNDDSVSFTGAGWSKTAGAGADSGFDVYSNSNDTSVKVKVQTEISDGITN